MEGKREIKRERKVKKIKKEKESVSREIKRKLEREK